MGKSADERDERTNGSSWSSRFSLTEGDEPGTERLVAEEVDDDLTDLLFQDPPPGPTYPDR